MIHRSLLLAAALGITEITAMAQEKVLINQVEEKVPPYTLPDPLQFSDGSSVSSPNDWARRRRELLRLFEAHVYGTIPAGLTRRSPRPVSIRSDALNGLAIRKILQVPLTDDPSPVLMELMVYLPKNATSAVPIFLGLNFSGNHTVTLETDVPLSGGWLPKSATGATNHIATEASRGTDSAAWPIEQILARGYGFATAHYSDIEPDFDGGWRKGVRGRALSGHTRSGFAPEDWGAISAWSWGLSRAFDALAEDPLIDSKRVALLGQSRLGKTALWAGARDPRFALIVANESGEGGAALARREFGETILRITTSFPHWFCGRFKNYSRATETLPIDQHELIALIAPRPVYIASAQEDLWADPKGEYLAGWHATPVYQLLGLQGLPSASMPALNSSVGDAVGYHIRSGKHALTSADWGHYLNFADRHLKH